ncbi:MAG: efflux RND transporter periplasmic adaptor subunit [Candidatus Kryptonium sp.]
MKWKIITAIVFSSLISLLAGYFLAKEIIPSSVKGSDENIKFSSEQRVLYYRCGMHPWVISDKPGKCHICGMDLTAVYEGEESEGDIVKIDPTIVQNIGVKVEPVRRMNLKKSIKTVGVVDYDETKIAVITTKVSGWIEKLYVDYTGKFVRKGEPLFEIYSPDLVTAQEEYLQAINYKQTVSQSKDQNIIEGANQLVESAKKRLLYWDITEEQIKEIERKQVRKTLTIYSPVDGVVIEKNIFLGIKVSQGMNLMKIVDLSTVWVYADIYEYELPWVRVGEEAEVEIPYLPGKILRGKISYIYPFLQTETRTVKMRLEFENLGYFIKPDMYVNVIIRSNVAINALAVPEQSVIRTGKRDIVVLSLGEGKFKSVEVKLGVLADGYYQVLEGLYEGQNIVTSSHFLIDSESNLRSALAGLSHQHSYEENKQNQETKETQKQDKSKIKHEHKDEKAVKSQIPNKAVDPVCGMEVDPKVALSYTYKGEKFYFCMKSCLEKFKKNPEKYLKK